MNYIQYLIKNHDFIFLCETWLLDSEIFYLKSLTSSHLVIGKSDMIISPIRGRPFGGRAFIYKKSLNRLNYNFINKHISFFSFSFQGNIFTIISVYLPFDNHSSLSFSVFTSSLQIIKELFNFYSLKNHSVFVFGDFNADLTRNNRFDVVFNNFLLNNSFHCISPSFDANEFTYHNGKYQAKLDHCQLLQHVNFNMGVG